MAVKIRLKRMGARKQPSYRIVIADSRAARDGRYVEQVGFYNPLREPAEIRVDVERTLDWLGRGAQPSESVRQILQTAGVWGQWQARRQARNAASAAAESQEPGRATAAPGAEGGPGVEGAR